MPPAVDFILYCLGISAILLSTGVSIKLVAGGPRAKSQQEPSPPKWEPIPDPASEGLENRLRAFQTARYASPIVRRQLDADAGPRPPRPPIPIRKPQPPKSDDKVVPLPMKMKKEPDKED